MQVLHLLLHKLIQKPYNQLLLDFLFVDEHLVDIGDDLVDYEVLTLPHHACICVLHCSQLGP